MVDGPLSRFAEADLFLSIVPPDTALATAADVLPQLGARRVPYVDCNAVSVDTVRRVAALAGEAGAPFIDASIIGQPPKPGVETTVFYAAGDDLAPLLGLRDYGLDIRPLEADVGAASALKMCYAGITKGLTCLGAAMILAATREGASDALMKELQRSQPELLALFRPRIPDMLPKAYRWSGEMEEIAAFVGADEAALIYQGMARVFERLARDVRSAGAEAAALEAFLEAAR